MTKQLAAEGAAHGIRANCISPGMIPIPATEGDLLAPDHPMRAIPSAIPLGRIGPPREGRPLCAVPRVRRGVSTVTGANLVGRAGGVARGRLRRAQTSVSTDR
jgi:meso-butanediol dehydrogenase / (S,S)-butanediol dehydrogenase / diacetyl reductase